jgi:hypothetical protein
MESYDPRVSLDKFREYMKGKSLGVLTQGYIRDAQPLSNGTAALTTSLIRFNMTSASQAANAPSQAKRLQINDAFCAVAIGLFIGLTPTTGGAISTATQQQQDILSTFPSSGAVQAADVLALQQLYNGSISIKESSTTWYEQIEAYGFYRVGTQQQGLIFATGGTVGNRSDWPEAGYGFVNLNPNFAFAGDRSYDVNLNVNTAAAFGALSGTNGQLWAELRMFGWFAAGGANYVGGLDGKRVFGNS